MTPTAEVWKAVVAKLNATGTTWALTFTAARQRAARWNLIELDMPAGQVRCAVMLGPVKTEAQNRGSDSRSVDTDVVFARRAKDDDIASADEMLGLGDQVLERFRGTRLTVAGQTVQCTGRRFATADEVAIDERLLQYGGVDLIAVRLEWTVME